MLEGRATVLGGDIYYSPNCTRDVVLPICSSADIAHILRDQKDSVSANDFQSPSWWGKETEWVSFIPSAPVTYSGALLEPLAYLPRNFTYHPMEGFFLPHRLCKAWKCIEEIMIWVVEKLGPYMNSVYIQLFTISQWGYCMGHPLMEDAKTSAQSSRDWFSLWVGLICWMCQKSGEDEGYIEGLAPPRWLIRVVKNTNKQAIIDSLRMCPFLRADFNIERVGLFLHTSKDRILPEQPPPQWFIERGIPIWYQWDIRDDQVAGASPPGFPPPATEHLQAASTWITTSLAYPASGNSIQEIWEGFVKLRRQAQIQNMHREGRNNRDHHSRNRVINWQRSLQSDSSPVYIWVWNPEKPWEYRRQPIRREERVRVLSEFHPNQKFYDTFLDEWNCCSNVEVNFSQTYDIPELSPFKHAVDTTEGLADRTHLEICEILSFHFGYVSPVPLPESAAPCSSGDIQAFICALGISWVRRDNLFFQTTEGRICIQFLKSFWGKGAEKPNGELWDLSDRNWRALQFGVRLESIHLVRSKKGILYMFDLDPTEDTPWRVAVESASAALLICRLEGITASRDIAKELVQQGVCFRTLQKKSTTRLVQEKSIGGLMPVRIHNHIFDDEDFEFYEKQCISILSSKRGRVALLKGGLIWQIVLEYIGIGEALQGPSGIYSSEEMMFIAVDSLGNEYIDDELTSSELDVLAGIYQIYTGYGQQTSKVSWFPLMGTFEGSGLDYGRWTPRLNDYYDKRRMSILTKNAVWSMQYPVSATNWRDRLRGSGEVRNATRNLEQQSKQFLTDRKIC